MKIREFPEGAGQIYEEESLYQVIIPRVGYRKQNDRVHGWNERVTGEAAGQSRRDCAIAVTGIDNTDFKNPLCQYQ